ncbi:general secretion pathway protein GspK, partial [bacterium]|nr:general secretion pathway protein GspK [bacterium]
SNTKEDIQSYYLALAGYNRAIGEIIENQNYWMDGDKLFFGISPSIQTDAGEIFEEKKPIKRDLIPLGSGYISYSIETESSKVNINFIQRGEWKERLINSGVEDESLVDTIINGIEDWKDIDTDLHRDTSMPGEDENYLSQEVYEDEKGLAFPYECKDGYFDCVEELLLIRGMTPEILYGSGYSAIGFTNSDEEDKSNWKGNGKENYSGIYDQLTVYNIRGVDIDLASRETLESMAAYNSAAQKRLDDMDSGLLEDEIPRARPTYNEVFTIIATGSIKNSVVQRSIKAIVRKARNSKGDEIIIMRWDDDYLLETKDKKSRSSETNTGKRYEKRTQTGGGSSLTGSKGNTGASSSKDGFLGGLR